MIQALFHFISLICRLKEEYKPRIMMQRVIMDTDHAPKQIIGSNLAAAESHRNKCNAMNLSHIRLLPVLSVEKAI